MNGVLGMTSLLLDSALTREQKEFVETIQVSADQLMAIINDILDFSKIEAGKMTLEHVNFDLVQSLEEVGELFAPTAHQKGVELNMTFDPAIPEVVVGDPVRFKQILSNLTNNAIKFTESGEVTLSADLIQKGRQYAELEITVRDTGIGIAPENLETVFQSFTQADGSTTRKFGGTGLGLTIVRQIIELMGGTVQVQSEVGRGSTFTIRLKMQYSSSNSKQTKALRDLKILAVDDNETNLRILERQMGSQGAIITVCGSAQEALVLLADSNQFDVIITDMMMPDMDGQGFAKEVRNDPKTSHLPIILLSSMGSMSRRKDIDRTMFNAIVNKPARTNHLRDAILSTLPQTVETGTAEGKPTEPSKPLSGMRVLLAEDNLVNQKVAQKILERLGCETTVVANGVEAIDQLTGRSFDAVLMDMQMPEMDGLEATRRIRSSGSRFSNIPIIALTANAMADDRLLCLQVGMDNYLSKPIRPAEMETMLQSVREGTYRAAA